MDFNYCPNCGAHGSIQKQDKTDYECTKCSWHFWNNPKATASTICVDTEGQLLFAKRKIEPHKGLYDIPGGFLKYNEDAYEGAIREIFEESGVRIRKLQLLPEIGHNEYLPGISTCDLTFITTEWEGEFTPHDDVEAFVWKSVDFIASSQFAWPYPPGLINRVKAFIATMRSDGRLS